MKTWLRVFACCLCFLMALTLIGPGVDSGPYASSVLANEPARPADTLVNELDRALQLRFEEIPRIGITRVAPVNPPNPHLNTFVAGTPAEQEVVAALAEGNWDSGIYLFGRRAYEDPSAKNGERRLNIHYKLNNPVPISPNLKVGDLKSPKNFEQEVRLAFEAFRSANTFEFTIDDWSYVARPVITRDACLQCHQDMFITAKLPDKKWSYRARRAGDPIGMLVYAFRPRKSS